MAIYTRWGSRVQLTSARVIPTWVERQNGRIKIHLKEKKPTRLTLEMREEPTYVVTARYDDDREGHGGDAPLWGGKAGTLYDFVADDGIKELLERFYELAPEAKEQFEQWNKADGPRASELFALADPNTVII